MSNKALALGNLGWQALLPLRDPPAKLGAKYRRQTPRQGWGDAAWKTLRGLRPGRHRSQVRHLRDPIQLTRGL